MRILFLGTPDFAVPSLAALIGWRKVELVGLVTQPDRPAGRGNKILQPPTKQLALSHGIPVLQPERLSKAPEVVQAMSDLKPDLLVTVAFGQILKQNVLSMAPHGVINVHGSLLPKYRGAAPINWALINGEAVTGITTMFSDAGIDTGKMLLKSELAIGEDLDAEKLAEQMSELGAALLLQTIEALIEGKLEAQVQDESQATYAPRLTKELGSIDWKKGSREIHNLVRGLRPWPEAYSSYNGQQIKILRTRPAPDAARSGAKPGELLTIGQAFVVACGDSEDAIEILELKPANKGSMTASAWANGLRLKAGAELGS